MAEWAPELGCVLSEQSQQKLKGTPTVKATGEAIDQLVSDSEPDGVRVCRACLHPPETNGEFCGHCGAKLVTIRKVKDAYIGSVVGEKYRVQEKIGQGGMGEVYLALNADLDQKVAVKFLSKRFADDENVVLRFLNEARSYCRVNHPNAVTLLEFGQHDDGALYIITEFIDGKSVTDTLKSVGPLSIEQTIDIGLQIAEVLDAAHEQGVIHRDLKPDNIMLTPSKRGRFAVKVLDFGIAKIVDDDQGPNTETGSVFGTPEFMSPEQARGDGADPRSDIYAFGIILFYVLTGRLPFRGDNKLVVLNKQLHETPPRPSEVRDGIDVPEAFEEIILRCLEKEPKYRYQSAEDILDALEAYRIDGGAFLTSSTSIVEDLAESSVADGPSSTPEVVRFDTIRFGEAQTMDAAELDTPILDQEDPAELHSVEMWREVPTSGLARESDSSRVGKIALVALLAVAGLVAAVWYTRSEPTIEPRPDTLEITNALNEGQILGMLAAAEQLLDAGHVEDARAAIESAADWSQNSSVSAETTERQHALTSRANRIAAIEKALKTDPCAPSNKSKIGDLKTLSAPLATTYQKRMDACSRKKPATKTKPGAKPEPTKGTTSAQEAKPPAKKQPVKTEPSKPVDNTKPADTKPEDQPPVGLPPRTVE